MNYLIYALLVTIIMFTGLIPVTIKLIELLQVAINERRFNLLKSISQLAIHKVNQLDILDEMEASHKKELAILTVREFASSFDIPTYSDTILEGTIEAVFWSDDHSDEDDEDFDD